LELLIRFDTPLQIRSYNIKLFGNSSGSWENAPWENLIFLIKRYGELLLRKKKHIRK
jgi:hypothetical protein